MSEQAAFHNSPSSIDSSASPGAASNTDGTGSHSGQSNDNNPLTKVQSAPVGSTNFPAPKTDKPRPHVCGTCGRCFARLEHLKRHERSHTKEKPFECPECTRCFARRDLLLRHQQKLHLTTTPPSRSAKSRRESTASVGVDPSGKVRKRSVANGASSSGGSSRPRANTISHIDGTTLGLLTGVNRSGAGNGDYSGGPNHNMTNKGLGAFDSRAMPGAANAHGLPRLATQGLNANGEPGLRTAPPMNGMNGAFGMNQIHPAGTTINPAQLHLDDSMDSAASNFSPFENAIMEDDDNFEWLRSMNPQMNFGSASGHGMTAPSASGMSRSNQGGMSDFVPDTSSGIPQTNGMMWQASLQRQGTSSSQFALDNNVSLPSDMGLSMETMSPPNLQGQPTVDSFYPTPPHLSSISPQPGMNGFPQHLNMNFSSDGNSISSTSANGSARHSSMTSVSTESITEVTRQALLLSLSQPSVFGHGHRKHSQPAVSSPLSPREPPKPMSPSASLPSTLDLQRYVAAYIHYFHPHFPFLHVPTLSFDTPAYTNNLRQANSPGAGFGQNGIVGGGGCLVLAMAAIGALYELERPASRELFSAAKRMIQLYLEERRKADVNATATKSNSAEQAAQNTPLWLVQAMLLNVIYGHNCGDKISGDIASTHCSALVSLARAAGLLSAQPEGALTTRSMHNGNGVAHGKDIQMTNDITFHDPWSVGSQTEDEQAQWHRWVRAEERKRTVFAIFHMSSLLVSAYNHAPALMNSEVHLDLPCEEDLWCADSASAWAAKGGAQGAEQRAIPFVAALSTLLTASQNQSEHPILAHNQPFGSGIPLADVPPSNLRPSTFGCLILINALHNYIWETRQRHSGRQWTTQETESMYAHIEPALRAWQAAWASNPTHSLERPNPFGYGPLSADSIPLLDLAYVRLFVNLGSSKEAFWQRDFDAMAEELARGSEFIQHADHSESNTEGENSANGSKNSPNGVEHKAEGPESTDQQPTSTVQSQSSKRERHLRKAAFYAADSMSMSDKLGVTFADFTSRELPVQSALCTFDCAQVLAEWVATVQERVGQYLGVLGRDSIDYAQVPAIMLLEDEDCKLLEKISDILTKAEQKMTFEIGRMGQQAAMSALQHLPSLSNKGYGSKILLVAAYMLERAAVWPVTNTMAQGLQVQAVHMNKRAENSTSTPLN